MTERLGWLYITQGHSAGDAVGSTRLDALLYTHLREVWVRLYYNFATLMPISDATRNTAVSNAVGFAGHHGRIGGP